MGPTPQLYSCFNLGLFLVETISICMVDIHDYRDQIE